MKFDDFDLDSVLADYAKYEDRAGLSKKASYVLDPDQVFGEKPAEDVPYFSELYKQASDHYNVKTDDLDSSWPMGNTKLEGVDAKDDLAVVEDLEGDHKKMLEMVNKEVKVATIIESLTALANKLDEDKLHSFADEVEDIAHLILNSTSLHSKASVPGAKELLDSMKKKLNSLSATVQMAQGSGKQSMMMAVKEAMNSVDVLASAVEGGMSPNVNSLESALEKLMQFGFGPAQAALRAVSQDLEELKARMAEAERLSGPHSDSDGLELQASVPGAEELVEGMRKSLNSLSATIQMAQGSGKEKMTAALREAMAGLEMVATSVEDGMSPNLMTLESALSKLDNFNFGPAQSALNMASKQLADLKARLSEAASLPLDQKPEPKEQVMSKDRKPTGPHQGMLMVQKKLNEIFKALNSDMRVPENGYEGDRTTWSVVQESPEKFGLGLLAGTDFKNYRELLDKLEYELTQIKLDVRESKAGFRWEPLE